MGFSCALSCTRAQTAAANINKLNRSDQINDCSPYLPMKHREIFTLRPQCSGCELTDHVCKSIYGQTTSKGHGQPRLTDVSEPARCGPIQPTNQPTTAADLKLLCPRNACSYWHSCQRPKARGISPSSQLLHTNASLVSHKHFFSSRSIMFDAVWMYLYVE